MGKKILVIWRRGGQDKISFMSEFVYQAVQISHIILNIVKARVVKMAEICLKRAKIYYTSIYASPGLKYSIDT